MITWYEFKHALSDLRTYRRWYGTYTYTTKGGLGLQKLELLLRRRACRKRGHLFPGGANGEAKMGTWKHFCVICFCDAPYKWKVEEWKEAAA